MITSSDLSKLLESGTRHALLDVRERATYERGHIYRATSLPRRLLETRLPRLVTARATPIVVYDDTGPLAALAAKMLGAMGYTDVRVLDGGLSAWRVPDSRSFDRSDEVIIATRMVADQLARRLAINERATRRPP